MKKPRDRQKSGFSLIEVALAIGVATFGLVAVMGLIPIAFTSSRASMNETRAAQIAQRLFTEFQSQSFTSVILLRNADGSPAPGLSPFDLSALTAATPAVVLRANTSGELFYTDQNGHAQFLDTPAQPVDQTAVYFVGLRFDNAPACFATKCANRLTMRVSWDLHNGANVQSAVKFSTADFSSVITNY